MAETPTPVSSTTDHRTELGRLLTFSLALLGLAASTYVVPGLEGLRPWISGEPLPLSSLVPKSRIVRETPSGELSAYVAPDPVEAAATPVPAGPEPADAPPPLPSRPPAVATPLVVPEGALDAWFTGLARLEAKEPGLIVRTLHWGDSTIAGDGITMTVRDRLQARFGDGGPGFLAVAVDPRWSIRPGILRATDGEWESLSITHGGARTDAYGLAGTISTATTEASATLGGRQPPGTKGSAQRQPLVRFDLFAQKQPGGGRISMKPRGAPGTSMNTDSGGERTWDDFASVQNPAGSSTVYLKADGTGPVTVYGVAMETAGPGLTWESFGVAGSGQGSMLTNQAARHLSGQVARREPSLLVYQTGGNELSYPSLVKGEGTLYKETYLKVLARLRAGAPEASCLVITPLDQATRERGQVVSKPALSKMVDLQRQAAFEAGCAFWSAREAMGGEGSFSTWLNHEPRLAWTDLIHLNDAGLEIIGQSLADALESAYDQWKSTQPPAPPVLPAQAVTDVPEVPADPTTAAPPPPRSP